MFRLSRAVLLCASLQAVPALAQDGERTGDCRLALVLALDVSGSVSAAEAQLQREGLAAALLAPEVTRGFLAGGTVALYVFEWAGDTSQAALLPGWVTIRSEQDLLWIASVLWQAPRTEFPTAHLSGGGSAVGSTFVMGRAGDGTAVGAALVHAAQALAAGPDCRERTVDVSGDGVNSDGVEPRAVLASSYEGVTVNALIIDDRLADLVHEARLGVDGQLVTWFEAEVLHGPQAFYVVADGFEDYEQAMTAKLLRELELQLVSSQLTGRVAG